MLGNDADALDATQDALLAAIRGLGRFDARSSLATWLYRIATNACIDEMRRRRRRPVTGLGADIADIVGDVSFGAPGLFVVPTESRGHPFEEPVLRSEVRLDEGGGAGSSGPTSRSPGARDIAGSDGGGGWERDPADVVAARVDVDKALASLPDDFRTAVVLRDVCDLPYDEIADILHVPVGTVRSRIARARSALATWGAKREPASGHLTAGAGATGNRMGSPNVKADVSDCAPASSSDTSTARQDHERRPDPVTGKSQKQSPIQTEEQPQEQPQKQPQEQPQKQPQEQPQKHPPRQSQKEERSK
jgi:RNA polymerase sigma-70 factor (ECF subfamily)